MKVTGMRLQDSKSDERTVEKVGNILTGIFSESEYDLCLDEVHVVNRFHNDCVMKTMKPSTVIRRARLFDAANASFDALMASLDAIIDG